MRPWLHATLTLCLALPLAVAAAPDTPASAPSAAVTASALPLASALRFAIIKTASMPVKRGLAFAGGGFDTEVATHFSAVLVERTGERGTERLLFDAGMGRRTAAQYDADMPRWNRPFFRVPADVQPVADQLQKAGLPPVKRILLSHAHWDHASGLEDFPGAEVWLPAEELAVVQKPTSSIAGAWPSQVADKPLTWVPVAFEAKPYEGFDRSLDLFRDGSAVLVPMSGHTPGSMGLFLRTASGKRFFFVGDVVWNAGALAEGRPKFWAARWLVDANVERTQATVEQIRAAMARDPALTVVPAHDGAVQDRLGLFPQWVQ